MKILIVEDARELAETIKAGLEENLFAADLSFDGEEGLYMAETNAYDAIILDIMLPKMDGVAVLSGLRKKAIDVPVILLTARGEVEARVRGLNAGADDYMAKPFEFTELLARLRAVIRRNKGLSSPLISIEGLTVETGSRTIKRDGREIHLSSTEYRILEHLVMNKGRIISKTELTERLYGMDLDPESNILEVYINFLRKKIDLGHERKLIHTVRGAGYILK